MNETTMNYKLAPCADRLQAKAADWNVTIDDTLETPTSMLGFGVSAGRRVVLKITKQSGDESHSGKVLRAFSGDGAVRVYRSETNSVLLERLEPGEQLVNVVKRGGDEEATKILAEVMEKLAHRQAPEECPSATDWGLSFDRYVQSGGQAGSLRTRP